MNSDTMVSICCITYNHEEYIRDALDSFLSQKTNFKFEILVHDDASTDNTAKIIKEYEEKYPNIIKPIYQTENQYRKNNKITANFLFPIASGKYIAMCEGDDYWIDNNKLQRQVDFLEENEEYSLVVHPSLCKNQISNETCKMKSFKTDKSLDLESFMNEYHHIAPKVLFQTSSLVFRSEYIKELLREKIQFYYNCNVGDIPLELFLASKGKIYYFNSFMSVYRSCVPGSWTLRQKNNLQCINSLENMKQMYTEFNIYTGKKYEKIINKFIDMIDFDLSIYRDEYKELVRIKNITYFRKLNIKSKVFILISAYNPQFAIKLKQFKNRILGVLKWKV